MHVPFVDLKLQYKMIQDKVDPAIQNVLDSSQYILGNAVEDFETAFAQQHKMKHCIGVGSGTDALHAILWALNIGEGDEVITVSHTFIATAEAISLTGAIPVFVDIDPVTYTMNPALLEKAITRKTKAIIPVHLYGQPADVEAIKAIADKHGIPIVEDACQSHLATFNGKHVGHFGIAAGFSFYPGKNLGAYGEAGGITTNDDRLAAQIRMLRDHGQTQKYHHAVWGHNYRLDGIQGAVLGAKLPFLAEWTRLRRLHAKSYHTLLKDVDDLILPGEFPEAFHVYHLFVVQTERRDDLQTFLNTKNIGNGLHYPIPLHVQDAYASLGYKRGDLPVTESVASRCLSLPMFPEMTEPQIAYVVESVKEYFKK